MAAVESMLSAIFCAVPHFMRVEPAITSGPVTSAISTSAAAASFVCSLEVSAAVKAPSRRARATAAITKRAPPLALMPTIVSSALTRSRPTSAAPA